MANIERSKFSFLKRRRSLLTGLGAVWTELSARAVTPSTGSESPVADNVPLFRRAFSAFNNKSLNQQVQELADREEIRELISRYAHCVAHGVSVSHLFTDDGEYIVRIPGRPAHESRGREQLVQQFARLETGPEHPLPMIHNYLLDISGDSASGMCSNEVRINENGSSIIGSGYYQDKLRRENGRWRFVAREATFFHWVSIQEGWATAPRQVL
jgi:SnoaL-like domain